MKINIHIKYSQACPYCKTKKIAPKRKTCGSPFCQYAHHIHSLREYWGRYYAKKETKTSNEKRKIILYPNHYLMKKNRLLKMKQVGGKCEKCFAEGKEIHHKDGKKDNHSLDNLIFFCKRCHQDIHRGRINKNSEFFRLYGMTRQQVAEKLRCSTTRVWMFHCDGELKDMLKEK